MVRQIRVYFEGTPELRAGFRAFFFIVDETAQQRGLPAVQLIAGRGRAVRHFILALRDHPEAFNVLLMDAEGPDDGRLISGLKSRSEWNPPDGVAVNDDHLHFMIQVMEAWFLADQAALKAYYGYGFHAGRLPKNKQVETIPKDEVLGKLKRASRDTSKGTYHKTRHAPDLLRRVDVAKVRSAAPACERLFETLLSKLRAPDP